MKFDVVIGNPPYNASIKFTPPTGLSDKAYKAAKTRIDACFVVYATECLIKETGLVSMVWPAAWTQAISWLDFRLWAEKHISAIKLQPCPCFGDIEVIVATTTSHKSTTQTTVDTYYHSNPYQISPKNGDMILFTYTDLMVSIQNKISKLPKMKLTTKPPELWVATGSTKYKPRDFLCTRVSSAWNPLRPAKPGKYYIGYQNESERQAVIQWWYEPLPSFIGIFYPAMWQSSQLNIGQLPDILAILKGRPYSRQLVYNELGLTPAEVEYLEQKTWDLFKIDGVQNRPEFRKTDKRKFKELTERKPPLWP